MTSAVRPYNRALDGRKVCRDCGESKPVAEFPRDRQWLASRCRPCWRTWKATHQRARYAAGKANTKPYAERRLEFRERYRRNRETILAKQRAARRARPLHERNKAQYAWRQRNRDRAVFYAFTRRARATGASGHCTPEQAQARIDYYGGRCYLCGAMYEALDHVIALARGGSNWPSNLRPICGGCNSRKGSKSHKEALSALAS